MDSIRHQMRWLVIGMGAGIGFFGLLVATAWLGSPPPGLL